MAKNMHNSMLLKTDNLVAYSKLACNIYINIRILNYYNPVKVLFILVIWGFFFFFTNRLFELKLIICSGLFG